MGQQPLTGTSCPFPLVDASPSQPCAETYAQHIGAPYYVMYACEIVLSTLLVAVMSVRMRRLRNWDPAGRFVHHRRLFATSIALGILVFLNAVNLFGFMTPALPWSFYLIASESVAATLGLGAILVLDYWISLSSPITGQRCFSVASIVFVAAFLFANFVGSEIVAIALPDQRPLVEAVQYTACAVYLVIMVVQSWRSVMSIYRVLTSESGADNSESRRLLARTLIRKFSAYIALLGVAMVLLLYASINYFVTRTSVFRIAGPQLNAFACGFQAVFLLSVVFVMWVFVLPASAYGDSNHRHTPAASTLDTGRVYTPGDTAGWTRKFISIHDFFPTRSTATPVSALQQPGGAPGIGIAAGGGQSVVVAEEI